MDEIIINELTIKATVGPDRWNEQRAQPIRVTTTLYTSIIAAGRSDNIRDTINYKPMAEGIIDLVEGGEFESLRTLAEYVAAHALTASDLAAKMVKVKAEALNQFLMAESLGVIVWKAHEGWEAKGGHDKGLINNLTANVLIGINPLERVTKQSMGLSIVFHHPKWSDVDWKDIYDRLTEVIGQSSYLTVEAFVTRVAQEACYSGGMDEVTVRCEKPNAFSFAKSAQIEITRNKKFFQST